MKRLFLALTTAIALCGAGVAVAQSHGSGSHGGGGWRGSGSHGSGSWHGGGSHGGGWHHSGWRGGSHFGLFVGFPGYFPGYYWPGYYPYSYYYPTYGYSYYYPAAPVYGDPGSVTYIEQGGAQSDDAYAPRQGGDAYAPRRESESSFYCPDAGYYPQVQNCAKGWLRVVPGGPASPRPR
jgi:hypothetical protein